jgi:uncharacterized membrane protein YgcG
MSRRQSRNRARKFARAIELEALEVRQLLTGSPDLVPSGVSLTASTVNWNDNDTVSFTVTNQGDAATTSYWQDSVYATTNSTYIPGDSSNIQLAQNGEQSAGPLAPSGSYTQNIQFSTYNLSQGTYNIFIVANGDNGESDDSTAISNVSTDNVQLTVNQVDLTVTSSSLTDSTISQGQTDHIGWTVQNIGNAPAQNPDAGSWYDAVVATTDSTFDPNDPNDKWLAYPDNPNGLDIGASYTNGVDFNTYGWAPGTYNVYVIANDGQWFQESNFANNISTPVQLTVNVPDLTVTATSATPSPISLNKTLAVNWTDNNSASALGTTENGWTDVVWISPNNTLDTSSGSPAQAIGYFGTPNPTPTLAPGQSFPTSGNVTIPTNIQPGTYYIFVQTGQYTAQGESDTTNDISNAIPIQVTAADLVVTNISAGTGNYNSGDSIPLAWTVTNQGNATADGNISINNPGANTDWNDALYWSYSPVFDGNAQWFQTVDYNSATSGTIAPGGTYQGEFNVNTSGWDGGQYYFYVQTDVYNGQEPESNYANNVSAAIPVTITAAGQPDLSVALNSAAPTANVGGQLEVNFTVQNTGPGSANNFWLDGVWLSPSSTFIQSQSHNIGAFGDVNSLNSGDSYTQDSTVTVPTNIGTGQYYVFIQTDEANWQEETNGANNFSSGIPVQINGSDETVTDFQASANGGTPVDSSPNYSPDLGTVNIGTPINVQWTVANQGDSANQNAYSDAVYLSYSQNFQPANSQLLYYTTNPAGSVDAGDDYTDSQMVTVNSLPNGSGTYYLFVVTDAFGDEPEGNENNNVSDPIQVEFSGPDLTVTGVSIDNESGGTLPANTVALDQNFNVSWGVSNQGEENITQDFYDSVYISSSPTFDPTNATQLLTFQPESGGMNSNSSYSTGDSYFNLPDDEFAPGQYYIFVVTDDGNLVQETNENNNVAMVPITVVGADLTVTSASVQPSSTSNTDTVNLSWTVENVGDAPADYGWSDEYYISTLPVFNSSAVNISGNVESQNLNPGDSYSDNADIDLSSYADDGGTYYLYVVTNYNQNQPENDYTNNVSYAVELTLTSSNQPDLTSTINSETNDNDSSSNTGTIGQYIDVTWTDNNIGSGSTNNNWYDEVYLSPTLTFDPNTATDLGSYYFGGGSGGGDLEPGPIIADPIIAGISPNSLSNPALDAGNSSTVTGTFYVPGNIGLGQFYIFVQTDAGDEVDESTNDNNISSGFPITVYGPDLSIPAASIAAGQNSATAPDASTVYAGGLLGTYYGIGSNGAGSISSAESYIAVNNSLAQFIASQISYPANDGTGASDGDNDTLANFLGSDANTLTNPSVGSNQLSGQIFEFDGYISLPQGNTTLWLGSDDGAELFINGDTSTPFIPDTGPHAFTWNGNTFDAPSAGLYAVKIIYYEDQGSTGVGLAWGDSTNDLTIIPSSDLYSAAPVVQTNQKYAVNWAGANTGNAATNSGDDWYDAVYISPTSTFDPNTAVFLGNQYVITDGLNPGDTYSTGANITIPGSVGAGLRYLFVNADDNNYELEGNEDNNLSTPIPIWVSYPNVDLEPTSFTAPESATLGEGIPGNISWTAQNNGSQNATGDNGNYQGPGDWHDQIYLSQNPWLDSTSVLIGSYDADQNGWPTVYNYGGSYSTTQDGSSAVIPENTAPGNYYLILAVDGDQGQGDSNFSNNDFVRPIQILPPNADLQITDATENGIDLFSGGSPPVLEPGESVPMTITVTNTGTTDATNSWTDEVYLSSEMPATGTPFVPDGSDIFLGSDTYSDLLAGQSYTNNLYDYGDPSIPSNLSPGSYYLIFVTDYYNNQPETNENNNTFVAPITISGPDLVVTALSVAPTSGNIGDQFTANWTVQNQGDGPANGNIYWYDAVYVSASPTFNSGTNIYVGEAYTYGPLASGDSYNQSLNFTMPGGLPIADVYVYVVTDVYNYLPEVNENNNVSDPFTVDVLGGPDLQAQDVTINSSNPAPAAVNGTINVSWNDANIGNTPTTSGYWYDAVYFSPDSTFDNNAQDVENFYISPGTIAPGTSYSITEDVGIPSHLAPGTYYIYVKTDVYNYQPELDENNNVSTVAAGPITIGEPDLTVTSATVDTPTLAAGQPTDTQWTVTNLDPTYAAVGNDWWDQVYISTTPNLSGEISVLATNYENILAPGASNNYDNVVTIPTGTAAGNYYLVFVTNANNNVGESNTNNNILAEPITVSNADLTMTSMSASPNPVSDSGLVVVTWTVKNLSPTTAAYGGWYDAFWLSQDGQIDNQSIFLGYAYEDNNGSPVLQPAGSTDGSGNPTDQYTQSANFYIPNWLAEGNYELIGVADGGYGYTYYYGGTNHYSYRYYNNLLAETNENNNTATTTLGIGTPDLTVQNASAPPTANSGDSIPISFDVANLDSTVSAANGWYDGVYLSSDPTIDGTSTLIGYWYRQPSDPLGPDSSYNISESVTIPEGAAPGNDYLIFATDIYNQQIESNENNNTEVLPITISSPDLTVTNASAPTQAIIGTYIPVTWTTNNIGSVPADGPWWDNVYISSDGQLDNQSVYLGQTYAGYQTTLPLAAGGSYSNSINAYIPANYPDGPADIFIVTDYYNDQAETNETNNEVMLPITIGSPDLIVSAASADSVGVQGKAMNVSFTVTNQGNSTAPNTWYDRISLSPDANLSDAVYSVDIANAGDLGAGDSYSVTNYSLPLPLSLATGTYYVLVTTDYYNNQAETDETNNTTDAGTVSVIAPDLTITASVAGETTGGTAGGLTGYYYGTGSGGAGSVANAQAYIASHSPLAQFVASQVQYPAGLGIGASDGDSDTFGNFLGSDANTLDNPAVKSNNLSGQIIEFDGFISLPAGPTTLWIGSDDGSELFLNGNTTTPLIDDDGTHGFAWASATYDAPAAGLYAVKLIYFEDGGSTGIGLAWGDSAADRTTIPEGDLFSAVSTLVAGNSVDVSWTVTNSGTTTALDSWNDRISISPDDNPADAIYSVEVPYAGNLAAGSSYSVDNYVLDLSAADLPQGTYHVLVTTDADNTQPETNEDNNTADGGLISLDSPDLTVVNPSGPSLAVIGAPAAISWTTENDGSYPATGPWVDNVYISSDGQFSDATLIGQYFTTALPAGTLPLAAGGQYTITDDITIPADLPTGSYTVFIETDAYNQVPETNENNNIASFTMQVGAPDLTITAGSADTSADIGTNMNVSFTVGNDGTSAAPENWTDTVYLTPHGDDNIADAVYHADFAHTGGLANGDSYTDTEQLAIPLSLATGSYDVIIVTDSANTQPETNENNNTFDAGTVQIVAPDLTITTASGPSTGAPGGTATLNWTVKNNGGGATISSNWYDSVYYSPDGQLDDAIYLNSSYTPTVPLAGGASYNQSLTVSIPNSAVSGTGYYIIITDAGNNVTESNESNNTYILPITIAVPDLTVTTASGPTSGAPGGTATINWTVKNIGGGSTSNISGWYDSVYYSPDGQLGDAIFLNDISTPTAPLAAGASYNQSLNVTIPNSAVDGTGYFIVLTDVGNSVIETNENNNTYSVPITIAAPDLTITTASAPTTGSPGGIAAISWTVENAGTGSTVTNWYDEVYFNNTNSLTGATYLGYWYTPTTPLAPGATYTQSPGLAIPAGAASGTNYFIIVTDYGNNVVESNENNNTYAVPIDVTPVSASIGDESMDEGNTGYTEMVFTVTLSAAVGTTETVNYTTPGTGTATIGDDYGGVSSQLVFAPGVTTQTFDVPIYGDYNVEADETFGVDLNNPVGMTLSNSTATGTILNDDFGGALAFSMASYSVTQGTSGSQLYTITVDRTGGDAAGVSVPYSVTAGTAIDGVDFASGTGTLDFGANQSSATFNVTVYGSAEYGAGGTVDLSLGAPTTAGSAANPGAAATLGSPSTAVLTINSTVAEPAISIGNYSADEGNSGLTPFTFTVTLSNPSRSDVTVNYATADGTAMISDDDYQATSGTLTFDPGTTSQPITVEVVGDTKFEANETFYVNLTDPSGATLANTQGVGTIINDDNGTPPVVSGATIKPTQITVQYYDAIGMDASTVQNPANYSLVGNSTGNVSADITSIAYDPTTQTATLTLNPGLAPDTYQFTILSGGVEDLSNLPLGGGVNYVTTATLTFDLQPTSITAPSIVATTGAAQINYSVSNTGNTASINGWVDEIYLIRIDEAAPDVLLDTIPVGSVAANSGYSESLNETIPAGTAPGVYAFRVVVDANNQVAENNENNNTLTTSTTTTIKRLYDVTVATTLTAPVTNGTPVPLYGHASFVDDGSNATSDLVDVSITVNGTVRTLQATTDSSGNFTLTFYPLSNEAGDYTVGAYDPDFPPSPIPTQATFEIVGMSSTPQSATQPLLVGSPAIDGTFTINNLSSIPLTGLTITVLGQVESVNLSTSLDSTSLAGDGTTTLHYSVSANDGNYSSDKMGLQITTDQGAVLTIPLSVTITSPAPVLTLNPTSLSLGMLQGMQTLVTFSVTNTGGAASGDLNVVLPTSNDDFLSLSTPATIPSLAPGATADITLALQPTANDVLDAYYTGSIGIGNSTVSTSEPYSFRDITSATGDLAVTVDDDLTENEADHPHLAGATVKLIDPGTGDVIATATSDSTGVATFTGITAGTYQMVVSAPQHSTSSVPETILPGVENTAEVFIQLQTVTYSWVVVPTTITDDYTIELEATFDTQVPAPVVTMALDPIPLLGVGESGQMMMTLTNHGLIATDDVTLVMPTDPAYSFTPLVTDVGILAAESSVQIPITVTHYASDPTDGSAPCHLLFAADYSYAPGDDLSDQVTNEAYQIDYVPGRNCDLAAVESVVSGLEGDLGGGGGYGGGYGGGGGGGGGGYGGGGFYSPTVETDVVDAKVKVEITQHLVLTRSAFSGTLDIDDDSSDDLTDLSVNLDFTDSNGNDATDKFFLETPVLTNINAIDGTGTLPANTDGSVLYTIIPDDDAVSYTPETFEVGGTLSYMDNGQQITVQLVPSPITVYPQASLNLQYFWQRDVYSDDPFTPQVEPAEPADVGVLVQNVGYGAANNLSITSSQPVIVENDKGLLINFTIIGTSVNGDAVSPSLEADLGTLEPGQYATAIWELESTLQGHWEDFTATFEHDDALGGAETSLINSVTIYNLIHTVDVNDSTNPADNDTIPDFLANEDTTGTSMVPDSLYTSNGSVYSVTDESATANEEVTSTNNGTVDVSLSYTSDGGWDYIDIPNLEPGLVLTGVQRSDGTNITVGYNAWTTDRIFEDGSFSYSYDFHMLDESSAGPVTYTLVYQEADTTPPAITALQSVSKLIAGATSTLGFTISKPGLITEPQTWASNFITLTFDGASVDTSTLSIVSDDTDGDYTIEGLAALTAAPGTYVLTLDASALSDIYGIQGSGTASDTWNVDTAPSVTINTPVVTGGAGTIFTDTGSFTDPDGPAGDSWTATVDYGDGSGPQALALNGNDFTLSHYYGTTGDYTATVTVTDSLNESGSDTASFDVSNAPEITLLQSIPNVVTGGVTSVEVTFSQPINIATLDSSDILLTRDGVSVDTSSLTVSSAGGNSYIINGLAPLTSAFGAYQLAIDATGVQNTLGVNGTGGASDFWQEDTAPSITSVTPGNSTYATGTTVNGTVAFYDPDPSPPDSWIGIIDYGDNTSGPLTAGVGQAFTFSHTYPTLGDFTVQVTVTDAYGLSDSQSFEIKMENPVTILSLTSISGVQTVGVPSVDVTFSEPININSLKSAITIRRHSTSLDTSSLTVSSDGGNTYTISGLSALTSAFGAYQLTVNAAAVQNADGVAGTGSATDSWQEDTVPQITNVAVNSNYIAAGSALTGTMSFSDPDPSPTDSWTGTVNYGETGDSDQPLVLNSDQSFDFSHVYTTPGVYSVTLTVTDAFGESAVASFDVHVEPSLTITNLQNITSPQTGGVPSVEVTFSQPINTSTLNGSDIILRRGGISMDSSSVTVTSDGGDTYTINGLAPLTSAFGAYTLTILADGVQNLDGVAGIGSATDSWQEDTAPIATFTKGAFSGVEGSVFADSGSFTDPDPSPPDSWTATINYDDGAGAQPLTLSGNDFSFSHTFSKYGIYDVEVTVTDAYGLSSTATDVVTVTQSPATITLPANTKVNINTPLSFQGTDIDPFPDPPNVCTVDYGDGTGSHTLTVGSNGAFTLSPDYTVAGRYTVVVTATDTDGTTSSNSFVITAVPNVLALTVNNGAVQRSMVTSVTVSFDDNVNVSTSSFTVTDTSTNTTVPFTLNQTYGKSFKLTLTTGQSIADGHYSVTINAGQITDATGDTLISNVTQTFWRRFGDMYGNGYVTLADLTLIESLVGKTSATDPNWATDSLLDYNGNGSIDSTDVLQLELRYGLKLY